MDSAPHRRILLADCDAMFVNVARLVDHEGARGKDLLIVGGRPDGRGVVASASYACRAYGVHSAMPTARALKRCPKAHVVSVPRQAVRRISRTIRAILDEYAIVLQPASVDEFYLDLSGTEAHLGEDLAAVASRIRRRVLDETAISLSIGGATNRLVAKLAASVAKPGGVHVVPPGSEEAFMRRFDLDAIPGVGPKSARRYARYGLHTVEDALQYPESALRGLLGDREGRWLHRRVRGVDPSPVTPPAPAKSHGRGDTFEDDLYDDASLERELLARVVRVCRDVRGEGRRARTVTVILRDRDFTTRQASSTLAAPTSSDRRVFDTALRLLRRLLDERRVGVRSLGVTLSGLVDAGAFAEQLALFGPADAGGTERARALDRAVDALRDRYGEDAVLPAALLPGRPPPDPES